MTDHDHGIERIRWLAHAAERRIRLGRALAVGARALCVALVVAVLDVALRKLGVTSERWARIVLMADGAGVLAAAAVAWAWQLPSQAGAQALDRFHALHDRLASALAFAARPEAERTPFMLAAIEDAIEASPRARPRAAVPILLPRSLYAASGLTGLLIAVSLFEVRTHVPVAHAATIEPVEMAPDDLDDVKDFLKQLQQRDQSDDTKAAVEEFNKLVDDIANKRLDRTEAFRRMEALEQKLLTGSEADKKALGGADRQHRRGAEEGRPDQACRRSDDRGEARRGARRDARPREEAARAGRHRRQAEARTDAGVAEEARRPTPRSASRRSSSGARSWPTRSSSARKP